MATPPKGRKMAPERPFPILIETGKSHSKTGLSGGFPGGFPGKFDGALPAVFRWFSGSVPAVSQRFSRQVRRRFSDSFPAVFSASSTAVGQPFSGNTLPLDQPPPPSDSGPSPSSERNAKKRQETSAFPYTLSRLQTQHSGIFKSVFVTKRLAKLARTDKN